MFWLKDLVREKVRNLEEDNTIGERSLTDTGYGPSSAISMAAFMNQLSSLEEAGKVQVHRAETELQTLDQATGKLKQTLGRRFGLSSSEIVLGSSTLDILRNLFLCTLEKNDEVLCSYPGRKDLPYLVKVFGAQIMDIPLASDLSEELHLFSKFLSERTKIVFISNPHFPTGTISKREELLSFIREMGNHRVLTILDESFSDFLDPTITVPGHELFRQAGNLVVLRTILALDIPCLAFGFFPRALAGIYDRIAHLFPLSSRDILDSSRIINNERIYLKYVDDLREERKRLAHRLEMMGCKTLSSHASFLLVKLKDHAEKTYRSLYNDGISIINGKDFQLSGHLIIPVRSSEQNERFLVALKKVLKDVD